MTLLMLFAQTKRCGGSSARTGRRGRCPLQYTNNVCANDIKSHKPSEARFFAYITPQERDVEGAVPYNIPIMFVQMILNRTNQAKQGSLPTFFLKESRCQAFFLKESGGGEESKFLCAFCHKIIARLIQFTKRKN